MRPRLLVTVLVAVLGLATIVVAGVVWFARRSSAPVAAPASSATASAAASSGPASSGVALYRDPDTAAAAWIADHPNDPRAAIIRDRIVSQPQARWFTSVDPTGVRTDTAAYVAAAAGALPVLVVYGIPNRDCGGASSGGAANLSQYQTWIAALAAGLSHNPVIVLLEPDSIALQDCLNDTDRGARSQALSVAVTTIKAANGQAKVYLDGGHSAWNGPAAQAQRLVAAGVAHADGFYTNVSNFNSTANETAYGRAVMAALASAGVTGAHQIIDTSRNGGASGDWCGDDNTDRRVGPAPTRATGQPGVDAYLWVKRPGEADGCQYAAGSFQPQLAFGLAGP